MPVVLAAGIEASQELFPRAIPIFIGPGGCPCNDRLPHLWVIARDQHEGRVRADVSEESMDSLFIRSDARLTLVDLVDRALGALQRREEAREPDRHHQGDSDQDVDDPVAERTRDWVTFSEPSLLPLMTRAVAWPLRSSLRNSRLSDASMCAAAWRLSKLARTTDSYAAMRWKAVGLRSVSRPRWL